MSEAYVEAQSQAFHRYGVVAESCFIGAPSVGGRAHVIKVGEGPPVVMINGIGTPAAMWAPLMAELGGFSLYAVDLPGFGLTDSTPAFAEGYRRSVVGFLSEVLDGLRIDRAPIVANSMGSLWATWLALDRSNRVSALAHVGCPAIVLDTSAPLPMRLLSVPVLGTLMMKLQPPSEAQVVRLSRMVKQNPLPPEIADLILATERLPQFKDAFLANLHTLLRLRGGRPGLSLSNERLREVTQPTLLIFGDRDPMGGPEVGVRMAGSVPDSELHVVDGGHTPWVNDPVGVGALVSSFLNGI